MIVKVKEGGYVEEDYYFYDEEFSLECCDEAFPYNWSPYEVEMKDGTRYTPTFCDYDEALEYARKLKMKVIE